MVQLEEASQRAGEGEGRNHRSWVTWGSNLSSCWQGNGGYQSCVFARSFWQVAWGFELPHDRFHGSR